MATSPLLGINAEIDTSSLPGDHSATGIDSMGPGDISDSGSDSLGVYGADPDSDTDHNGTGERSAVEPDQQADGQDILPDHVSDLVPEDDILATPDDDADGLGGDIDPEVDPDQDTDADADTDPASSRRPLRSDDLPADVEEVNFDDGEAGRQG